MVETWFAILTLMLAGYAIMDGWNIGAGVVQFLVARTPGERRLVTSAIGPLWTWHEVWLVASGGVLFVAFPSVLAVALPGFYLAVFVLLWCIVGRGLSLEFGGHIDDPLWRTFWDVAFTAMNLLIAILLGTALGNIVRGVPLGPSGKFSLAFFTDFTPRGEVGILDWYTGAVALFTVTCVAAHGASYLVWKTEGEVHARSLALARRLWLVVFILMPALTVATAAVRPELFPEMMRRPLAWVAVALALGGSLAIVAGQRRNREGLALAGGCAFIAGLLGAAAASIFPVMLRSTLDPAYSIDAYAGAVRGPGLALAAVWWPVAMILSLVYGVFVFRQFKGKVRMAPPRVAAVLFALLGLAPVALAQERAAPSNLVALPPQPEGVPWPTVAWPTGSLPDGAAAGLDRALSLVGAQHPKLGETRAVVVIHHGRLVAERYAPGFGPDTPLVSWSMAKSVTQALLGIQVRKGLVDIDKPMGSPHWGAGDARAAIPWRHWINMTDGQEYHEIGVVDPTLNDAATMLYGRGRRDVAAFAASLPLIHKPGAHWNYNSAGINLISDALTRLLAPNASAAERRARMARELRDELFAPIGMTSAQPEFDRTGLFLGSALVYATPRDWARFGLLYLRDGVWDGRRILPEGWVDFARTKPPASDGDVYGAGFWVTPATGRGKPQEAFAPNGPRDIFLAQGHEGQVVVIVPSKDLVLVRLGLLNDFVGWGALGEWATGIINLFPDLPRS